MVDLYSLIDVGYCKTDFPCSPLQPVPSAKETAATSESEKNSAMKASSVNQSTKEESLA